MRRLVLIAVLALWGCDDGTSGTSTDAEVTPDSRTSDSRKADTSRDGPAADTANDSTTMDTVKDGATDATPSDGGFCVNWADMGIDCCDVCTEIYVTCKQSVKDKQGNPLTGKQCLDLCKTTGGIVGKAYSYVMCMIKLDAQVKCDPAALQACFDKIFE